jgi:hypothetical protein
VIILLAEELYKHSGCLYFHVTINIMKVSDNYIFEHKQSLCVRACVCVCEREIESKLCM